MKRMISVMLGFLLVFSMTSNALASNEDIAMLSDLSDQECLAFLKERGLVVPDIYDEEDMC